jgi:hypothetical protein
MTTVLILRSNLSGWSEIPLGLLWLDFILCIVGFHSLPRAWINESHFSTWFLCLLDFNYTGNMCFWHPPVQKTKMLSNFPIPFLKKRMDHPPWKMSLIVGQGFSRERDNKPHFKFYMKKDLLAINRKMPKMFGFCWIYDRLWARWDQSLIWGLV